jgi:hypothetical protein
MEGFALRLIRRGGFAQRKTWSSEDFALRLIRRGGFAQGKILLRKILEAGGIELTSETLSPADCVALAPPDPPKKAGWGPVLRLRCVHIWIPSPRIARTLAGRPRATKTRCIFARPDRQTSPDGLSSQPVGRCLPMANRSDWEQIRSLGRGGQSEVFLVRSPQRKAEREKCVQKLTELGGQGLNSNRAREFAEACSTYARDESPSELGALKIFNPHAAGPDAEKEALGVCPTGRCAHAL